MRRRGEGSFHIPIRNGEHILKPCQVVTGGPWPYGGFWFQGNGRITYLTVLGGKGRLEMKVEGSLSE